MGPSRCAGIWAPLRRLQDDISAKGILQGILDKQLQDESKTKSFNKGYAGSDKTDTLEKFLLRG